MLQQFCLDCRLNRKTEAITLISLAGFFLLGVGMVLVIMHADDDPGAWFCMGTLLACIALLVVQLIFSAFSYAQEFSLALSFGRTRTAFMGAYALRIVLRMVLGWLLILGLHRIELALYPRLFPQYGNEIYFGFLTNWRIMVPIFLGLPVLSMFIGALYGHFGKKGLWLFYIVWLFCCFVLPRMFHSEPGGGALDRVAFSMQTALLAVPVTVWIPLGLGAAAATIAGTIYLGHRQMVR